MGGSRLMGGALIILFVLVTNAFAAFIASDATSSATPDGCTNTNNVTTCEAAGKESFFASIIDTTFTGFPGAPLIVNALWAIIMGTLLTVAVLMIVLAFIPLTSA